MSFISDIEKYLNILMNVLHYYIYDKFKFHLATSYL